MCSLLMPNCEVLSLHKCPLPVRTHPFLQCTARWSQITEARSCLRRTKQTENRINRWMLGGENEATLQRLHRCFENGKHCRFHSLASDRGAWCLADLSWRCRPCGWELVLLKDGMRQVVFSGSMQVGSYRHSRVPCPYRLQEVHLLSGAGE